MAKKLPEHIRMRLLALEQRLQMLCARADKLSMSLSDEAKTASPVRIMRGLEKAASALVQPVRTFLFQNYKSSGIGHSPRSGKTKGQGNRLPPKWLEKMIAATTVKLIAKAAYGDNTLIPTFEINLGGPSAGAQERTVAATLNWGGMHTGVTMRAPVNPADMLDVPEEKRAKAGAAAKRSLKKWALSGKISDKAYKAIRRGATFKGVRVTNPMNLDRNSRHAKGNNPRVHRAIHLGPQSGTWSSIPYPFFFFTTAQMTTLKNVVAEAIEQEASNGR